MRFPADIPVTALPDMLPAGEAGVQTVANRLRLGTPEVLARQYLCNTDLQVEEISYLLACRDPNSFGRAFQGWTGQTPMAVRGQGAP
ncbi:hypothetical protein [uncultured Tateyamaria sp.]|uniref:helix-turn-helix domain-containing protein n=1 Tax=uncultured Tateyamaria sp. TaxID=455651 RepID=UPI00260CD034|nr:hypothetical protein [uncultured Tateyamaria sp.]